MQVERRHYVLDADGEPQIERDLLTWAHWCSRRRIATSQRVSATVVRR